MIRDLLGGMTKNTFKLFRMLPVVFRELCDALIRFFRLVACLFVQFANSDDLMIFSQISSKIHCFWHQF